MPKLLFLITQGHWGGAQKYVYDLATALAGEFDITVAVGDPEGERQLQEQFSVQRSAFSVTIVQLKHLRRAISPIHDLLAVWEIKRLYQKIQPDIVHLNSSKAGVIGSFAKWVMFHGSCVMIYTAHGWVFEEPLPGPMKTLYRLAEKYTARAKDAIITLSEEDKKIAREKLGVPINRLALIRNGVNPPTLLSRAEARQSLNIPADAIVVGTIANHYKTKGLDVLLQAVAGTKKEIGNNLQVIILGDGPERRRLEALIDKLDLHSCVRLTGFLPDAAKYLTAFDIFVLPSRKEGSPYILLEAMHAGLPIIATTVGAIPTIITNGEHGLLVPRESPDALSTALRKLINDPEYANRLGLVAQNRANNFSLDQQIAATTTLYQSLLHPAAKSH